MKSILVLGANGMLGYGVLSSLVKYNNIHISASIRSLKVLQKIKKRYPYNKIKKFHALDVLKIKQKKINQIISQYDFIINCIGVIKPEINLKKSQSIKKTFLINSFFPSFLSNVQSMKKTKIFQIATDCVFSGKIGRYNELSKHDDVDIYGVSKSMGEVKKDNFYNLRTSIVGREFSTKKSLVEWFLSQNKAVNGYENHNWNGITTKAFGEFVYTIINNDIKVPPLLHIIPKNTVNKYQLLQILKKKFKTKTMINRFNPKSSLDRSLTTIHKNLNNYIWKKTIFKSKPSIEKMVSKL
jgi:dTDP-4-dehydrorhamnose reductase